MSEIATRDAGGRVLDSPGGNASAASTWKADPRTKLLSLLVVNALAMGKGNFAVVVACFLFSWILLLGCRDRRILGVYAAVFLTSWAAYRVPQLWVGTVPAIVAAVGFWASKFAVASAMAVAVVATTGAAELSAALIRLRVPRRVVVPFSVMLRFIPTVVAEFRAILQAMRLRGIFPTRWSALTHPLRLGEFVLVPLLASSTRIGDDLAASGLIRGLGAPGRPTSIVRLGFGGADALLLAGLAGLIALRASGWQMPV